MPEQHEENSKLQNLFYNYYQKIGLLEDAEPKTPDYLSKFLRERFVERILFTALYEFDFKNLAGKSILLVGLSHELVSFFLKLGAEPDRITVADLCPQALQQAKAGYGSGVNLTLLEEIGRLPFPADSYDLIVCFNYLSNLPTNDYVSGLAGELRRVLKPEGLLAASFTNDIADREVVQMAGILRLFRPEEILEIFNTFKIINLLSFIPYQFTRFSLNEAPAYPQKIGFLEDLLIENNQRYTDSLLLLSK